MHYLHLKYYYFVETQQLAIIFLLDNGMSSYQCFWINWCFTTPIIQKETLHPVLSKHPPCLESKSCLYWVVLMQISGKMLLYCHLCFSVQTRDMANIHFLYVIKSIIFIIICLLFWLVSLGFIVRFISFINCYVSQMFPSCFSSYVYIFVLLWNTPA